MAEAYRCRRQGDRTTPCACVDRAAEAKAVAKTTGLPRELVEQVAAAETVWLLRRGYIPNTARVI